jgi:peptide/nickel transport system ATP-binding protein
MQVLDANQDWAKLSHQPSSSHHELLRVRDLSVNFRSDTKSVSSVLRQINFAIARGEIVGLLGESGSGKTTTSSAIMRMLPSAARVVSGSMQLNGEDLQTLNARQLQKIRGSEISIIHQNSDVLNPVMRVGDQVMEVLRAHKNWSAAQRRDEVYAMFSAMGFDDNDRIFRAYPHQLSGGQRRRVAIAQALVCKPRLVIADEPTAWLDSETTNRVLSLFLKLRDTNDTAFLLISHDPDALLVVDRVLVMYAGQIIESGLVREVFTQPKHPYTQALLECTSSNASHDIGSSRQRLPCIPGQAPDPAQMLRGCSFASRCRDRMELCDATSPELIEIAAARSVRCLKQGEGRL